MVYYFHRKPKAFFGGQLRLYPLIKAEAGAYVDAEAGAYVDIEPQSDSVVFFPSWFPHEVLPVHCESGAFADGRFSINCWCHKQLKPKT
jgi:Rps23 Pro-64 3,4-dihydroxylase Tpa1-like proline 4-hydroxylase